MASCRLTSCQGAVWQSGRRHGCLPGQEGSRMQIDPPVSGTSVANELDVAGEARLYRARRGFWQPVMYAPELTDPPRGGGVVGGPVVLGRRGGEGGGSA